jgi:S-adenosylmethionine:tRNA ribosyltransferase-isomerase
MRIELFDFELPPEHIALRPANPRDAARMLCVTNDEIEDGAVLDLPNRLRAGDCLVFNDTRVIPAQLEGVRIKPLPFRGGVGVGPVEGGIAFLTSPTPSPSPEGEGSIARIGATLHKRIDLRRWQAFIRNAKRLRAGDRIEFGADVSAIAQERLPDGSFILAFDGSEPVELLLERAGRMPLPPYIAGKRPTDEKDRSDYQTMFANKDGAVAAPTASLHFTPRLMQALAEAGIGQETLTLHVGAGTFLPVKADDTDDHHMHAEWGKIDANTAARLNAVRASGGRLIAVGTTVLRLLESAADDDGVIQPFEGDTAIFIIPGYKFKAVDGLMTNFHLPKSTLFMLVSALMGLETMQAVYAHAIANGYRFYSYGDSSLLIPA